MLDFGIVDAHLHIWDTKHLSYPWLNDISLLNRPFLPEDYIEASRDLVVEKMVFLQCECDPEEHIEEVEWVMKQAEREPRLKGLVPFAPLELGNGVEEELSMFTNNKMIKGIRRIIQFEPDLNFCLREDFITGVNLLPKYDFTFDICIDHRHNQNIIQFLEKVQNVPCMLNHIGKPDIKNNKLDPWRSEIKTIASFPNVFCKVSSIATEADHQSWTIEQLRPYVDCIFENFGFQRTVFASDWPVSSQAATYPVCVDTLLTLVKGASPKELYRLFRQNAEEFYRI